MTRYTIQEHSDKLSTGHYYTIDDSKCELPEQLYDHEDDAQELCDYLNNYEKEVNKYKFLFEEKAQILAETEKDRQVYLTLTVKLAKKLGFKGPGEFHDALCEWYLEEIKDL